MHRKTWILLAALLGGCDDGGGSDPPVEPPAGEGEGEPAGPTVEPFELAFHREAAGHMRFADTITGERLAAWADGGAPEGAVERIPDLIGLTSPAWFSADDTWVAWLDTDPALRLRLSPVGGADIVDVDLDDRADQLDTATFGFAGAFVVFGLSDGRRLEIRGQRVGAEEGPTTVTELDEGGGFIVDPWHPRVVVNRRLSLTSTALSLAPVAGGEATELGELRVQDADTGGDYTGREPGAVSPDGKWLALVTSGRRQVSEPGELRLRLYSTEGGETGGLRLGPGGQGRCEAALGPDEFTGTKPVVRWAKDAGAVYLIGTRELGCGFDGISDHTALVRVPVDAAGAPGEPSIELRDDHPTNPAVIHDVGLTADGSYVVALQPGGRPRGTLLHWGSPDGGPGIDSLVRLSDPGQSGSDAWLRVR